MSDCDRATDTLALRLLSDDYATAVDRRDLAALRACFVPDGRLVVLSGQRPPQEYVGHGGLASVIEQLRGFALTVHHVTTCSLTIASPEAARGTVSCVAHHVDAGGSDLVLHVRYDDEYRTDATRSWRIVDRTVNILLSERRAGRLP